MKIVFESELMENHKHAMVMAPDLTFDVLQTQDGSSLFFSIGTDNVFYLTREVTQTSTGWSKIDLSSALSAQHNNSPIAAKTFGIAQNAQTLAIDLALVVTVGGVDFLYLSLGNANTDATWANGVTWTAIPFDAANVTAPSPFTIADVFLMNIPADEGGSAAETIFVDILRSPGDPLKLIDRYYITSGAPPQWNARPLPEDASAGSISSCLGKRTVSHPEPAGIYTFGTIGSEQQLVFVPQYNFFKRTVAPTPVRLTLPAGASAIASAINSSGVSNLFVSGTNGLYVFTPDNQNDQSTPVQIVSSPITAGANSLSAATVGNRTAVWGIDPQGNLFYTACPAGQEANSSAWSPVVPLLPSVEQFAFFLNLNAGNNVLFAHVDNQNLIQLTQDPVTSDWLQRSILLPATSMDDVIAYNSYTTHIQTTDDNNIAAPNTNVQVTATSPVSVYINDVYYRLSPTVPVSVASDATGVITVVQETQSLNGVYFRVVLTDHPDVVAEINPMSKALAILNAITATTDLGAIQVTNADGTQQPLVPSGVSDDDKKAAVSGLVQFSQAVNKLPQDGSVQKPSLTSAAVTPRYWGVSFANGNVTYHEGDAAVQLIRSATPKLAAAATGQRLTESSIEVAFGDFFRWIKQAFEKVVSFVVEEAENVYRFVCTIGEEVYHVVLDCVNAVVHAVEFVFNKIKVFFEDLIKWLGFIFQWGDILRTHNVLKNIFNQYLKKAVNSLDDTKTQLQNGFTEAVKAIDQWAGIPDNLPSSLSSSTVGSLSASGQPVAGQNSPQSNWGTHHFKSNASNGTTTAQPNSGVMGDIESLLQPLMDALAREKEVLQAACDSFKSDIIDKVKELSVEQILKAIIGIIGDALLESVENVLLTAIDVFIHLTEGILDTLNATIDIPVISWLYKLITGNDLSLLDLTCLVTAIPITIGYKLITEATPFPDDATTTALINAPDFASIQKICNPVQSSVAAVHHPTALLGASKPAIDPTINKKLILASGIASAIGAGLLCVVGALKKKFDDPNLTSNPIITFLNVANFALYLGYASPDIFGQLNDVTNMTIRNKKWWAKFNEAICDLMCLKVLGDAVFGVGRLYSKRWNDASPWLDCGGNIIWQIPTTAALIEDRSSWNALGAVNFMGGTFFDLNGIMSPPLASENDPFAWALLFLVASTFNCLYGLLSCTASVAAFNSPN